ncbi:sorting nexin-21 [Panthera tigris]|uniref:sorting nexin-21 n=1 Tax=Panthera tigris TaxID=9694 RepID=UPI001C6F97A8|nr:sorting nexin-21 [Panthera tigris]
MARGSPAGLGKLPGLHSDPGGPRAAGCTAGAGGERRAKGRKRQGEGPSRSRAELGPRLRGWEGNDARRRPGLAGPPTGRGGASAAPLPPSPDWARPFSRGCGGRSPSLPGPSPSVARSPQGAMASRLLHRLRHALAGDSPGEAAAGPEAEQFPESSELEDDDAEGLSSRLSGTLSFTSAEDEEEEDDEDDGDIGPDPLPAADGASGEDAERSPPPDGQRGSQPLTRQLQDFWKKSRNTLVPQRLLFEVTSANVVKDPPSKYVLYTLAVMGPGPPDRQPAQISRRYSDFERLHRNLQRQFRGPMAAISFPRKRLRRNFTAETIARRSRAFEQFLSHLQAVPELRHAPDLQDFFVLPELRRAQSLTCTGLYREALALWANAWQLQTQLGTPSGPDRPLLTLAGLAVCHQELEDPGEARACCERALQLLGDKNPHPLLAPFLEAHVRLSWRLGLDKRQSEARLQALQEAGLTPTPPPSLKELLIKEVLD